MGESERKNIQDNLDKLDTFRFMFNDKKAQWIKQILIVLIAFLSVIITFKSNTENECISLLFLLCLSSLGISLFFGVISLYRQVHVLNLYVLFQEDSLEKRLNKDSLSYLFGSVKPNIIYIVSEYIFYITSSISLVLMVIYGILT